MLRKIVHKTVEQLIAQQSGDLNKFADYFLTTIQVLKYNNIRGYLKQTTSRNRIDTTFFYIVIDF